MDPLFGWLIVLLAGTLLALWLLLFAEIRIRLERRVLGYVRRIGDRTRRVSQRSGQRLRATARGAHDRAEFLVTRVLRRWLLLTSLIVILLAPAALVLGLHRHVMLQGYDRNQATDPATAALVAGLLEGEQLAPPRPLPPTVFVTPDVERVRPELGSANRRWASLAPGFRQRLLAVFRIMQERYGYHMALLEGYRSPERQGTLAAKGANVTQAGPGQSYHQYGLAADCAFYRDGKLLVSEQDQWAMRGYELYGDVARAAGLVWGGDWKMRDLGHVELHVPDSGPRGHQAQAEPAAG